MREARAAGITWPVQPALGIPLLSRLDRNLVFAVREQAPYNLTASIDKDVLIQGEKAKISLQLTRNWPDFKTPLQVAPVELPPLVEPPLVPPVVPVEPVPPPLVPAPVPDPVVPVSAPVPVPAPPA